MIKVEFFFAAVILTLLIYGGWCFLKHRLKEHEEEFSLYLVVQNQENCLEGIIRILFRYLSRQEASLRLILLVESSGDQTLPIAQRLAHKYSFELIEIVNLAEWQISTSFVENENRMLLYLRGNDKGLAEARRIRKYIGAIKQYQSKNN